VYHVHGTTWLHNLVVGMNLKQAVGLCENWGVGESSAPAAHPAAIRHSEGVIHDIRSNYLPTTNKTISIIDADRKSQKSLGLTHGCYLGRTSQADMQTVLSARRLGLPYGPCLSLWPSKRRFQKAHYTYL
jgi:hypothetical protein